MENAMSNDVTIENGFDTIPPGRPLDPHYSCARGHWLCNGELAHQDTQLAVLVTSWLDGEICWEDPKRPLINAQLVIEKGLWKELQPGYGHYTHVLVMDQMGRLGCFTS